MAREANRDGGAERASIRSLGRPLIPREHGAWAMLFVPFAIVLGVVGKLDLKIVLFLLATLSFYLARAPLEQLVRSRTTSRGRRAAWGWLAIYLISGLVFTGPLLFHWQLWWLVPLGALLFGFLGLYLYLLNRGAHRSLGGRLLGISGLTSAIFPAYYVAAGALDGTAVQLWLLSVLFFGGTLFHVRLQVHRAVRPQEEHALKRAIVIYYITGLFLVIALGSFKLLPLLAFVAYTPSAIQAVRDLTETEYKLDLKRIGFIELSHALGFALLLIGAYRIDQILSSWR